MGLKRAEEKIKPVEQWTVKEWETAYNVLVAEHNKLRATLRRALQCLNSAV